MSNTIKYEKSNRVMLGDIKSPEMLIYTNIAMRDIVGDGNKEVIVGDCEVKLYLGGRPIILHNDTGDEDPLRSMREYRDKLNKMRSMVSNTLEAAKDNPDESYIERDFLNTATDKNRLFGGTMLIHYSGRFKIFTLDICDCNNKSRKSFTLPKMDDFAGKFIGFLDEALGDLKNVEAFL